MKILLIILLVFIGCTAPQVKDISLGNCGDQQGIFIPLEEYGNFDAQGRIICYKGYYKFGLLFNGRLISFTPIVDEDGSPLSCKQEKEKGIQAGVQGIK
jgi:hypothetical protein